MAIKYVQVINSFVSTEGSNGFMTNYIYYSLLVVDTDGSARVVEGKADQISFFLPYIRTTIDEIEELKETVRNLRKDINEIADQKAKYMVDSLFPLPDILNKNEVEAIDLLEKAGLQPVLLNQYPETTPKNGIVRAYARNGENFKKVDLKIIHDLPVITGLKIEEALEQLTAAGFHAKIAHKTVSGEVAGTVLECTRDDENTLNVDLLVSNATPETKGLPMDEAKKLLKEAGCRTMIEKSAQLGESGKIIHWENLSESTIKLHVSVPAKYEAKHVDVKWSNMQDSTGDSYSATAEFCNNSQHLHLRLTYTIGAKTKHQLMGAEMRVASKFFSITGQIHSDLNMEPGVQNTIAIDFPFRQPFDELSKEVKVTLQTQYGLMKKRESIDLQLTFDW